MNIEPPPQFLRVLTPGEHRACLGLGSNMNPVLNLRKVVRQIRRAVAVDAVSTAWQSPAVGLDGPDYVNAALLVRTPQSKEWLIAKLKAIENVLGRVRDHAPSNLVTIDIDLLVFDRELTEDDLWNQIYRATPVAELLPDLCCPGTGETVVHAATRMAGTLSITPRPDIFTRSHRTG